MTDHTINLSSTLADLLKVATSERRSKAIARFDMGAGREVVACVFVSDTSGYISVIQAYEDARDRYANQVANAVAKSIAENGLPDLDDPQPFNIVESSDGEDDA